MQTLKELKGEKIELACRRCDRHAVLERKALVKKFGVHAQVPQIRRVLTMGCDLAGTDECEAAFGSS